MKSITLHNLDPELAQAIEQLAESSDLSQNKTIKKLLRKALGLDDPQKKKPDFNKFCGIWSEKDLADFEKSMEVFEKVDKDLWL